MKTLAERVHDATQSMLATLADGLEPPEPRTPNRAERRAAVREGKRHGRGWTKPFVESERERAKRLAAKKSWNRKRKQEVRAFWTDFELDDPRFEQDGDDPDDVNDTLHSWLNDARKLYVKGTRLVFDPSSDAPFGVEEVAI
jgi:hypothetical protein